MLRPVTGARGLTPIGNGVVLTGKPVLPATARDVEMLDVHGTNLDTFDGIASRTSVRVRLHDATSPCIPPSKLLSL